MAGGKHRAPNPHRNKVGYVVASGAVPLDAAGNGLTGTARIESELSTFFDTIGLERSSVGIEHRDAGIERSSAGRTAAAAGVAGFVAGLGILRGGTSMMAAIALPAVAIGAVIGAAVSALSLCSTPTALIAN